VSLPTGLALAAILVALAGCGGGDAGTEGVPQGEAFDRAFIDAMVPHHESAIEMAAMAGAPPPSTMTS
jgi:Domain of unknown function (DUF305)